MHAMTTAAMCSPSFSAPLARELPQAQIPLFMGLKILSQNNASFSGYWLSRLSRQHTRQNITFQRKTALINAKKLTAWGIHDGPLKAGRRTVGLRRC
jgi:hypothetical protein